MPYTHNNEANEQQAMLMILHVVNAAIPETTLVSTTSESTTGFVELGSSQGIWGNGSIFISSLSQLMFPIAVSVSVVVVCTVVVAFITGLLGLLIGVFIGYCWGKTHSRKPHPPPPAAPLYDDITVTTTPGTQLELKENVAYGHVTMK